MAEKGRNKR